MPSISRPQMPASIDQFVKFSNKHLLCFLPCCPSGLRRACMCIHKTNCYPPLNPLLKFSFAKNLSMASLHTHGKHPLVWSCYSLILIHLWWLVLYFDYIILSHLRQSLGVSCFSSTQCAVVLDHNLACKVLWKHKWEKKKGIKKSNIERSKWASRAE